MHSRKGKREATEQQGTSDQKATGSASSSSVIVIDEEPDSTGKDERSDEQQKAATGAKAMSVVASEASKQFRETTNFNDVHGNAAFAKQTRIMAETAAEVADAQCSLTEERPKVKATTVEASVATSQVGQQVDILEDCIFLENARKAGLAKAARDLGAPKTARSLPAKAAPSAAPYQAPPSSLETPPWRREATRSPRPEGRTRTTAPNATASRRVSWSPNALGERAVDSGGQRPSGNEQKPVSSEGQRPAAVDSGGQRLPQQGQSASSSEGQRPAEASTKESQPKPNRTTRMATFAKMLRPFNTEGVGTNRAGQSYTKLGAWSYEAYKEHISEMAQGLADPKLPQPSHFVGYKYKLFGLDDGARWEGLNSEILKGSYFEVSDAS